MSLISELKKNAPDLFILFKASRLPKIQQELQDLRNKYKSASDQEKVTIKSQADILLNNLKEFDEPTNAKAPAGKI